MEKALFFNSVADPTNPTGYDRPFNADDISDFLSAAWDTGVLKSHTDNAENLGLKIVPNNGMSVTQNVGRAAIKGKSYYNDSLKSFTISPNGTSAKRYDYIVLRYDNNINSRTIKTELVTGSSNKPTLNDLTRNDTVYELMLAYIEVAPSATSITQANIIDTRGDKDLCPYFTAVKGYDDYYDAIIETHEYSGTISSATPTVVTDIASSLYNDKYSLVEVYTNGLKEPKTAYSVSASGEFLIINFTTPKAAGAEITVKLDNFIDGEGMSTALAQYNQLVQDVANLKTFGEYNYVCNGVNDNVKISEIAQAFINDATTNTQLTINVYGKFGITAAYGGDGSTANRYKWFDFNSNPTDKTKRIILDFSHCDIITVPVKGNTRNAIFIGYNMHIKNARLVANCEEASCRVDIFSTNTGDLKADNCYFESLVTGDVYLTYTGTFTNCEAYLRSKNSHAYGFYLMSASKPCIVIGGRYRVYTGNNASGYYSTVVYASSTETKASCVMYAVNMPTVDETGYYQKHIVAMNSGYFTATGLITTKALTMGGSVTQSVTGTIPINM